MLINCPECGKTISDQAVACPNCGYDIRAKAEAKMAQQKQVEAVRRQAEYDRSFTPNKYYQAAPWPFKPLFRPFTVNARSPRIEVWSFFFVWMFGAIAIGILEDVLFSGVMVLTWLWLVYATICLFTALIRRSHDAGGEGAQVCVLILAFICLLIPIIGWIVFVIFFLGGLGLLQPSEAGSNAYGPNPFVGYDADDTESSGHSAETTQKALKPGRILGMVCPECGAVSNTTEEVSIGQHLRCGNCGTKFSFDGTVEVSCPHCDAELELNANEVVEYVTCPNCNRPFTLG